MYRMLLCVTAIPKQAEPRKVMMDKIGRGRSIMRIGKKNIGERRKILNKKKQRRRREAKWHHSNTPMNKNRHPISITYL